MGLVDSILGGNQGDAYLEQIAKQRQARKQQAASNASALLDLSKLANDDASIANVENMANNMPGFGATNSMYKSAIKESIKGKRVAYDMYKEGINDANSMLSEEVYIPSKNKKYSISEILNDTALITELPRDAIIDINNRGRLIANKVETGKGMSYSSPDGFTDKGVIGKFSNFQNMMNTALTASIQDGTIDTEEIPYILAGREKELAAFNQERKTNSSNRLKELESDTDTYNSRLNALEKMKAKEGGGMSALVALNEMQDAEFATEIGSEYGDASSLTVDDLIQNIKIDIGKFSRLYDKEEARFEKLHGFKYRAGEESIDKSLLDISFTDTEDAIAGGDDVNISPDGTKVTNEEVIKKDSGVPFLAPDAPDQPFKGIRFQRVAPKAVFKEVKSVKESLKTLKATTNDQYKQNESERLTNKIDAALTEFKDAQLMKNKFNRLMYKYQQLSEKKNTLITPEEKEAISSQMIQLQREINNLGTRRIRTSKGGARGRLSFTRGRSIETFDHTGMIIDINAIPKYIKEVEDRLNNSIKEAKETTK
jgi:hypothetical protein